MRIVLTTFGSLGDLHPSLAIAMALKRRGHDPVIATSGQYRERVEREGIGFHAVRPDMPNPKDTPALMKRIMDQRTGSEVVVREFVMPHLRDSYDDLLAAVQGADLLVSHVITFMAPLVAEKTGIPWASTILAPLSFLSAHDPPVVAPAPWLAKLRFLGPRFHRPLFRLMKWAVRSWSTPWHQLRAELGLRAVRHSPLFEGQNSPRLVLALFSRLLGAKQPDWPAQTVITGFPFYDEGRHELPLDMRRFLDDGPPPLVFTLGSSAVLDPGTFFETSAQAARKLGRRALLLVGSEPGNRPSTLPEGVAAFDYAPYAALFPRAAAIVHQGGVGTTAQAMRSGKPMLVMPYAHDQPDNAARVVRLGAARTIARRRYTVERACAELRPLLDEPKYAANAMRVGDDVRQERGAEGVCDELERM